MRTLQVYFQRLDLKGLILKEEESVMNRAQTASNYWKKLDKDNEKILFWVEALEIVRSTQVSDVYDSLKKHFKTFPGYKCTISMETD